MDPAAALAVMRDETEDLPDRIDAGRCLMGWLRNGGFIPAGLFTCGETYDVPAVASGAAARLVAAELATLEWQS